MAAHQPTPMAVPQRRARKSKRAKAKNPVRRHRPAYYAEEEEEEYGDEYGDEQADDGLFDESE